MSKTEQMETLTGVMKTLEAVASCLHDFDCEEMAELIDDTLDELDGLYCVLEEER